MGGGSLLKLIYLELDGSCDTVVKSLSVLDDLSRTDKASGHVPMLLSPGRSTVEPHLSVHVPALGGQLHFARFATSDVDTAVEVLRENRLTEGLASISATGGG